MLPDVWFHPRAGRQLSRGGIAGDARHRQTTARARCHPVGDAGRQRVLRLCRTHVRAGKTLSWGYTGLLRHLPDRPVIGLQARALSDPAYRPESVEELAADYLSLVTEFQPTGPYHLLGWSFGGRVAFEMAAALQRAGQQVGAVVLLDSSPPPQVPFKASTDDFAQDQVLRELFLAILSETTPIEADRWENTRLSEIKAELDRLNSPYVLLQDEHFERMFRANKWNYVLSRRYVPRGNWRGAWSTSVLSTRSSPTASTRSARPSSGRSMWTGTQSSGRSPGRTTASPRAAASHSSDICSPKSWNGATTAVPLATDTYRS
ncbi:alpha/beta fold hydrolase [Streptomyces flaveolus]|uniref:thioesterase domain-containing protein n=1 Tax=Streptomyces flaveolus TaxID=67297 RepID=UPI0033B1CAE9